MTRKKVKLAWIVKDSTRKASLKKRRVGLLKKVSELATLCGVDAFVIIYSPDDNEPAVWPSPPVVQQFLERFHSLPKIERSKKLMNQETYLKERVGKVHDEQKKLNRKNLEVEVDHLMSQINKGKTLDEFHMSELQSLAWLMVEKSNEIKRRVDYFQQTLLPLGSLPPQGLTLGDDMGRIGSSGGDGNTTIDSLIDPWFLNIINNSENVAGSSGVISDIGLPPNTYVGSSSIANNMGLLPHSHGTFRGHNGGSGMGLLPHGNIGGNSDGNIMGMQPQGNIEGGNSANYDIRLGQQPHGTGGVSTGGSEAELPFGIFGGSSGGSDNGMPFDVSKNNWS